MESEKRRDFGSGTFSTHVYVVEMRAKHSSIVLKVGEELPYGLGVNPLSNLVVTPHEWTRLPVGASRVGVPNRLGLYAGASEHGFMTYACAMALSCWAQATYDGAETRLVQIEYKYTYSTQELGVTPAMNLWEEDRQLYWKLTDKKGGAFRELPHESATPLDAVDPSAGAQERGPRA
jgi:hypothetical protein